MSSKLKDLLELAHDWDIYLPTRTIFLTGEIDESTYELMVKNLHALDTEPETVTIYVNSEGGDFDAGMAIYSAIKGMKSFVRCIIWGQASSIASVIAQACDERIIVPMGVMMIHSGSDGHVDSTREVQQKWREYNDVQAKQMEDIYLDKIKNKYQRFSRKRLQEMLKTDTILSAEEAVKLGLVDFVKEVI